MKNIYQGVSRWCDTLKKISLGALFALGTANMAEAQVSAYSFSQSNGVFTEISGTVLATATANTTAGNLGNEVFSVPLPFAYAFNGVTYPAGTNVHMSNNGFITFGTAPAASVSSPISSTVAYDGVVSAFGGNLSSFYDVQGKSGDMRWTTMGTAPNRQMVFQWTNFRPNSSTATTTVFGFTFQIILHETTNDVVVMYNTGGYLAGTGSISGGRQVGLRGTTRDDFNNRLNPSTVNFNNSTPGTSYSSTQYFNIVNATPGMPAGGLTYRWSAPSCFAPSNITSTAVTTTSVDLSWTASSSAPANGYTVYYSTSSTAPTATTVLNATNSFNATGTTASITGLTAGTLYYFWVRSNCSATDVSDWSMEASFATNCLAFNVPFSENFDSTPVGTSTNNTVPTCWTYLESSGMTGYGYTRAFNPASSPNSFYMYNSSATTGDLMLVTPVITNLSDGTKWVKFSARSGSANNPLEVGTLTNPTDPATFTIIGQPIPLTTTHTEYTVLIPAGTAQHVAFRHGMGGTYRSLYIDDVLIQTIPTCFEPSAVTVTGQTTDSGTLTWTAPTTGGAPLNYTIYYSTTNAAPTATTVLNATNSVTTTGTATTGTITGLDPSTTYYVWVRANCSATDSSMWTQDPVVFATNCLPPDVSAPGMVVCPGASAALTATSTTAGANFNWYDSATGGTLLGTGATFNTPNLTTTTDYYVTAFTGASATVGATNPSIGSGGYTNLETYRLFFTVNSPVTISTVDIYPAAASVGNTVEIGVYTAAGTLVQSVPHVIVNGGSTSTPETVTLNIAVTPGDYYMKMVAGSSQSIYRNTTGSNFPYSIPELSITGHSFNGYPQYYYYFYNWTVSTQCESPRTLVTATVDSACMSTNETGAEEQLSVYPNPFTDVLNIMDVQDVASVSVTDMAGRTVKVFAKATEQLQLGELKTGMYLVTLKMKDGTSRTVKAIKK